jgi:hypothetical protein
MTDLRPFFWTDEDVCVALGNVSLSWLRKNRRDLEADGFPRRDPVVTGRYVAADVRAWIENRRQVREKVVSDMPTLGEI